MHQSKCFIMLFGLILLCFSFDPCIHGLYFRVDGKEVLEFLGDKSKANEEDASLVIAQLVEALCYLHRQNVVHLDIRVRKRRENDYTFAGIRQGKRKKGGKTTRRLSVSGKVRGKKGGKITRRLSVSGKVMGKKAGK